MSEMGNVVRHETYVVFASLSLWSSQINSAAMPTDLRYFHRSWVSKRGGEIVTEMDPKSSFSRLLSTTVGAHWNKIYH